MRTTQILRLFLVLNIMVMRVAIAETTESIWDTKISLEKTNNMPLRDVFSSIENKSKQTAAKYQGIQIKFLGFDSVFQNEVCITLPSPLNLTLMQAVSNVCLVAGNLSYQFYGNVALVYAKDFGTKTIVLQGYIFNAVDSIPILEISIEESAGRYINAVVSTNGHYICLLDVPFVYTKGICVDNEDGMDVPSVKISFKALGFKTKEIEFTKEKILFNHPNIINLRLEPVSSHE